VTRSTRHLLLAAVAATLGSAPAARADTSAPAILQVFESTWANTEARTADAFLAGYGALWVPPPGRAETGGFSVGYDQYDRFDLGSWDDQTLYGTERGVRRMNAAWHRMGGRVYADLVWNHNGFADLGTPGFPESGAYPGFALTLPDAIDGDFHPGFIEVGGNVIEGRLFGLIDIDHETNFRFIRNPVDAGDPRNLPAGTSPWNGRLANVPDEANRRFYPSQAGSFRDLFDPATGESFRVYDFRGDGSEIVDGTPVEENALGYLMRNAQWYVQDVGFDGFRLDAVKHMEPWVLEYFDRAVYGTNPRRLLDGSVDHVFSFGEVLDGDQGLLQSYTRKDIDPSQPDRVGGNRDALDFPLHFALKANLTNNGLANDWRNIVNSSFDANDGLANDGSQGVAFDASHDDSGADLGNVANAYLAMRPGNWVVYHNAKQFGDGRDFPRDGRGDALGGLFGDTITTLVGIRNTHGRGDYREAWLDKETLVYAREGSAIVALSNRLDGGFDERWVDSGFAPGTRLVELTGNAEDAAVDPFEDIPAVVTVQDDGRVGIRVPRNVAPDGDRHDRGYVIYGLPTPQGALAIEGASGTIPGGTPTGVTNGTTRLADYTVVTGDAFTVALDTVPVTLADGYRDLAADGDAALLKINAGLDVNGNGVVDNTSPGGVAYGFETFATKTSPLALGGDGEFRQLVDTTLLPEGVNFVEVRAFRQRNDGGPAVYTPFKEVLYVDRLPPESAIQDVVPFGDDDRDFLIESVDGTADSVHFFANLPVNVDPLTLISQDNRAEQVDRDLFKYGVFDLDSGNHAITVVTYEITGNVNVQRFGGVFLDTGRGAGLGDLNASGVYGPGDVTDSSFGFEALLYTRGDRFHPAGDLDGDGDLDTLDLFALEPLYRSLGEFGAADAARAAELRRGDVDGSGVTDAGDIDAMFVAIGDGSDDWLVDLDTSGLADSTDLDLLLTGVFETAPADANLDGRVDLSDFLRLRSNFGAVAGWAGGDFTGDGRVDLSDFLVLRRNFGAGTAGGPDPRAASLLTIPEPAVSSLVLLAVAGLGRRRRGSPHRSTTSVST
jgi:hypothetical protein